MQLDTIMAQPWATIWKFKNASEQTDSLFFIIKKKEKKNLKVSCFAISKNLYHMSIQQSSVELLQKRNSNEYTYT